MNRLEELLLLWQDQSIAAEEVAELKQWLAAPEARATVAREFFLTGVVLESLRVQKAAGLGLNEEFEAESATSTQVPVSSKAAGTLSRKTSFVLGGIAASLVLVATFFLWPAKQEPNHDTAGGPKEASPAFAQVEQMQGDIFVVSNQQMLPARAGQVIAPGQGIATEGAGSEAVVKMEDAVRLTLGGDTTVFTTIAGDQPGKGETRVVLEKGDLLVDVTRSLKRKKTTVQTALGSIVAETEETSLHVSEAAGIVVIRGEVTFCHRTTGKTIRLRQGEYLAMTADGDLYPSQLFAGNGLLWTTFPRTGLNTTSLGYALAFSRDGQQLAAVNRFGEGGGRMGAVHGQGPPREFKGERCVQFSSDGKWLATADQSNVLLYDLTKQNAVRVFPTRDRKARIHCLAFSPDGKSLAVGRVAVEESADLEIWDVATGTVHVSWREHLAQVTCVAFSPDGKLLASGSLDKAVILWDMATGKERTRVVANPAHSVWSLAFAPNNVTLAIATGPADFRLKQAGEVALWHVHDDKIRTRLHGHSRAVTSVTFSRDSQTLITGSADTTVRFWNVKTSREYGLLKGHKAAPGFEAVMVALSPDGAFLATVSFDQTVKIWPTTWIRNHPASARLGKTDQSSLLASRGSLP